MIDWDDILEDVNWGKIIGILVAGIILITVVIYVLLDYSKANQLSRFLETDLTKIEHFRGLFKSPADGEIEKLENQAAKLEEQLNAKTKSLPSAFDLEAAKQKIQQAAQSNNIEIRRVAQERTFGEGYADVYPMEVVFSVKRLSEAQDFLAALRGLEVPVKLDISQIYVGSPITARVNFYVFDEEEWKKNNECAVTVAFPEIPARENEFDSIVIFKGQVGELKSKVDREYASIVDAKSRYLDYCKADSQVKLLQTKLKILEGI